MCRVNYNLDRTDRQTGQESNREDHVLGYNMVKFIALRRRDFVLNLGQLEGMLFLDSK